MVKTDNFVTCIYVCSYVMSSKAKDLMHSAVLYRIRNTTTQILIFQG